MNSIAAKDGGKHFNPSKQKHGPPEAATRHTGDFGNITADKDGNAMFEMKTDSLTLKEGPDSVMGRIIVIHARTDDGKTQPARKDGGTVALLGPDDVSVAMFGNDARRRY